MHRRYRMLRSLGLPRRKALVGAFAPLRLLVALHVLRGRPTLYRVTITGPIVAVDHMMIASTTVEVPRG